METIECSLAGSADLPGRYSLLSTPSTSLIVEAVKQAEDGPALIMRSFDAHGSRGPVALKFSDPIGRAAETDLLEKITKPREIIGGRRLVDHFRPYEIKTHRVAIGPGTWQTVPGPDQKEKFTRQ